MVVYIDGYDFHQTLKQPAPMVGEGDMYVGGSENPRGLTDGHVRTGLDGAIDGVSLDIH